MEETIVSEEHHKTRWRREQAQAGLNLLLMLIGFLSITWNFIQVLWWSVKVLTLQAD